MKYYIYVDESGAFDEGLSLEVKNRSSIVGGVCGNSSTDAW